MVITRADIYKLAAEADLSHVTVEAVITGQPREGCIAISPTSVKLVRQAAKKLGIALQPDPPNIRGT